MARVGPKEMLPVLLLQPTRPVGEAFHMHTNHNIAYTSGVTRVISPTYKTLPKPCRHGRGICVWHRLQLVENHNLLVSGAGIAAQTKTVYGPSAHERVDDSCCDRWSM